MVHGSPPYEMKRSKPHSKDCRPVVRQRSSSMRTHACWKTRLVKPPAMLRSWLCVREESGVTCQVPASPLPLVRCPINHSTARLRACRFCSPGRYHLRRFAAAIRPEFLWWGPHKRGIMRYREHAGQRVKIKEIAEAMVGNTVWCCNNWFAPLATPCAEVAGCTFKDRQVRLATPRELYKCRMFQITTCAKPRDLNT